ncbi:aspartate dehydrogenase [Pelobium manganitolerans]|uniref:L-aspartate dehydrogenase n=1 Tax=Pelobium manganitolerans TaxID=1842495 RepID=A0A419S4H4_9SPHI|nr:aspartate dehydrogenase domain-containing protein [Pelobium manganitolerans]RKD14551.1 aspartate dehydrogenase [Pelobium manganitolerans]
MKKYSLAIVGCGKLAHIVADAINNGLLEDYKLIGAYSRTREKAIAIAEKVNPETCAVCGSMDELLALKADYIVETASPASLKEFAFDALKRGSNIVTLSIGAFTDKDFYEKVQVVAREHNSKIYLASGAIGGFDVLRTAALMGNCTATFDTEKGPNSLKGTSVYEDTLQTEKKQVFKGDAIEAINLFPTRVNVAVAASLASVGPEKMKVSMTSTPGFVGDDHRIEIKNDQVHAVIDVYSSTAQIAGWSVVNVLRNITSPIVF